MAKCTQCGRRIDNDSSFCKYCGCRTADVIEPSGETAEKYAFCAACGARIPHTSAYCLICGVKAGQAPPEIKPEKVPAHAFGSKRLDTSIANTSEMEISEIKRRTKEKEIFGALPNIFNFRGARSVETDKNVMARAALGVVVLLIVGVAVIGFWRLLPLILPGEMPSVGEGMMYIKDGAKLALSFPDRELLELTDKYILPAGDEAPQAKSSPDGKYLAYTNADRKGGDGYLYLLDLSRLGRTDLQAAGGLMIAEETVKEFDFSQKGNYIVYLSSGGGLYGYDFKKSWLIDTEVGGIIDVGDGKVLYMKNNLVLTDSAPQRFDIYLRSINMETDDKIMVAQNASQLLDWTKNYLSIIYAQATYGGASDVIRYDTKLYQSETLVTAADVIIDVSAEQAAVIFAKKNNYVPRYEQLVDDPRAEADKRMKKPEPANFGLPEEYEEIFEEKPEGMYDAQLEIELQDMYYDAYHAFLKAQSDYNDKLERDALRAKARNSISNQAYPGLVGYEISLYRGNVTQVLEDNIFLLDTGEGREALEDIFRADIEKNYAVYLKSRPGEISGLDLSVFSGDGDIDVIKYITDNIPRQFCISKPGESTAIIYDSVGGDGLVCLEVTDKADGIYYALNDKNGEGALYYCGIRNGGPTEPLFIDKGVSFIADSSESFNGSMLYIKDAEDNSGSLYGIKEGQNPALIAEDISVMPAVASKNSGKSLLYYRRYDLTGNTKGQIRGELYLMTRQERLIVGDVYTYDYRGDKLIYLIRDMDKSGKGELYLYREGGVTPVDTDVTALVKIGQD